MATDITYFLKTVDTSGGGDGDSGGNGGGGGRSFKDVVNQEKNIQREIEKGNKSGKKGLGATLGIKFGIASLLKQSQVFTGFVGTIFQLMGALVDIILAPFLPILIPGIMLIASLIPYVAKYAQAVYDFLDRTIFQWFSKLGWFDGIAEATKKALSAIIVGVVLLKVTGLWNVAKSLFVNFIAKPLWRIAVKFFGLALWDTIKIQLMILEDIVKAGVKGAIKAAWNAVIMAIQAAWKAVVRGVWSDGLQPIIKAIKTRFMTILEEGLRGLRKNFIEPLFRKVGTFLWFFARPFRILWKAIAGDVVTTGDGMFARVLKVIKAWPAVKVLGNISKHLTDLFTWLPRMIGGLPIVATLKKWLGKELLGKLGGLFKGAKGLVGKAVGLGEAGRGLLSNAPGSGIVKAAGKNLSPSALKKIAQGFKAIPILGAVAELGFGGWQTYKDYKKYGAKAAMGRAALTLANTTAALFDPTGLASAGASIASNIAMDQAYKRMLDPKDSWKRDNPDIWIRYEDTNGVEQYRKKDEQDRNNGVNAGRGNPVDRTSLDGMGF